MLIMITVMLSWCIQIVIFWYIKSFLSLTFLDLLVILLQKIGWNDFLDVIWLR